MRFWEEALVVAITSVIGSALTIGLIELVEACYP